MENILEFLYQLNAEIHISDKIIFDAYAEILTLSDKEKSNIFISILFTYLLINRKDPNIIAELLKISFRKDNFTPYSKTCKIKSDTPVILSAGSGKKGIKTINISTVSAIVATSLGAKILKPCSMATSSKSGSYDFLNMIGINTEINYDKTIELLNKCGLGIFPIEKIIPNFDKIYGNVFYSPNILSYALAALICPIKPDIVLYGLAKNDIELSGDVLKKFGVSNYRIVSSKYNEMYFMDELNIFGKSFILDNGQEKKELEFNKILNLKEYNILDIGQKKNREQNVKIALDILNGKRWDAYAEIISLNTGNLLQMSGLAKTIEEGYRIAKLKIQSGLCIEHLKYIINETRGDTEKLNKLMEG